MYLKNKMISSRPTTELPDFKIKVWLKRYKKDRNICSVVHGISNAMSLVSLKRRELSNIFVLRVVLRNEIFNRY